MGNGKNLTINDSGTTTFNGSASGLNNLLVENVSGKTVINGTSIQANGTQEYDNPVTLDVTTDLAGTRVTFKSTVDSHTGAEGLTITGDAQFGSVPDDGAYVGSIESLSFLHVTGTTDLYAGDADTVHTSGPQTYDGTVTLHADTTLEGTTVTFNDTVVGGSNALTITGNAVFGDGPGEPASGLTTLLVTGTTLINGGSITSSGDQTYEGAVTLGANAVLTTGALAWFESTVSGGDGASLTIAQNGGVGGNAEFDGAVTGLTNLLVQGTTRVNTGTITSTGTQEYVGAVTLGDSVTMTGLTMTFDSTVDGVTPNTQSLTVAGNAVFKGYVGDGKSLHALEVTGSTRLSAGNGGGIVNTVNTGADQTYDGPVTLAGNTTLHDTGAGIFFKSTVNSDGTPRALVLNTGNSATVEFDGNVGLLSPLSSLTRNADGFTIINAGNVRTTGPQTYNDTVRIEKDTDLTGTTMTFAGTVDSWNSSARSLTVTGNAVFDGYVGGTFALKDLTVTGTTELAAGNALHDTVTTTGDQTYHGAVTLAANTTLTDSGLGVFFLSTVDSDSSLNHWNLTVDTPGTVEFGGPVGSTYPLGNLTTEGGGTTEINGGSVTTTGFQSYDGDIVVSLGMDTTLTGDTITLPIIVGNGKNLTINDSGTTTFNGSASGLNNLLVENVNGNTVINGTSIQANGTQEYDNPVTLDVTTDLAGTRVTFKSTVDSHTGAEGLTITGDAQFGAVPDDGAYVGSKESLSFLHVTGTTDLFAGDAVTVHTSGTQTYDGAVMLHADTILQGSTVTFNDQVLGGGNALQITGNAIFGDGSDPSHDTVTGLKSLDVTGSSTINTSLIQSANDQDYHGPVLLGADTQLQSTGSGALNFFSTIDGAHALLAETGGTTTFDGFIGDSAPLTRLEVTGAAVLNAGSIPGTFNPATGDGTVTAYTIRTTGEQKFDGSVTLGGDTALMGVTITFAKTIPSPTHSRDLLIFDSGTTTFGGVVGSPSFPLGTLYTAATGVTRIGANIFADAAGETVYFNNPVVLAADVTITTYASGIYFNNTVDSDSQGTPRDLDVVANGAGSTVLFARPVGGVIPLGDLTVSGNGTTSIFGGSVTTVAAAGKLGNQTYDEPVIIANTVLTGHNVTFESTVDSAPGPAQSLQIYANGTTTFGGVVGGTHPPASVWIGAQGVTDINGGAVTTTGDQTYNNPVVLDNSATHLTTLTGVNFWFGQTVGSASNGVDSLTVNGSGVTTFLGTVGPTGHWLNNLVLNDAGYADLNGGQINTTGDQTYNEPVNLTTSDVLVGADITFNDQIDGEGNSLTVTATSSATTFNGPVINVINLTTSGVVDLNGGVVVASVGETFNGPVHLSADTILTCDNVTFNSTLDSDGLATPRSLIVNATGDTTFNGAVGSIYPLSSLTVEATGHTFVEVGVITVGGTQIYNNPVTLTGATVTFTDSGSTGIFFNDTVDSDGVAPRNMVVNATGSGSSVEFNGQVGHFHPLGSLIVSGNGTTYVNGGTVTSVANAVPATTGDQTYNEPVRLGAFTILTGHTMTFNSTLDGTISDGDMGLLVNGNAVFMADVGSGGSGGRLRSLEVTGTTFFGAGTHFVQTSTNDGGTASQLYDGAATLADGSTWTLTTSGGLLGLRYVTFGSTVDGQANGQGNLIVSTGGDTTFTGAVGATHPLGSLYTTGSSPTNFGTTYIDGGYVATSNAAGNTGKQMYDDAVVLGVALITDFHATTINFNNTLDAATAGAEGARMYAERRLRRARRHDEHRLRRQPCRAVLAVRGPHGDLQRGRRQRRGEHRPDHRQRNASVFAVLQRRRLPRRGRDSQKHGLRIAGRRHHVQQHGGLAGESQQPVRLYRGQDDLRRRGGLGQRRAPGQRLHRCAGQHLDQRADLDRRRDPDVQRRGVRHDRLPLPVRQRRDRHLLQRHSRFGHRRGAASLDPHAGRREQR